MNEIVPSDELPDPLAGGEVEIAQDPQGSDDSKVDTLDDSNVAELDQAAIAEDLTTSAPSARVINLFYISGANAKVVGHNLGNINFDPTRPNVNEQTIGAWYRSRVDCEPYDVASIAAVAFLPMSPVQKQRRAAKALALGLGLGRPPLADTFDDSLARIGALIETTTSPFTGNKFKTARLPPERAEVRQYLWSEVLRFEEDLSPWVREQGASSDLDVSMRIGLAVGDLTLELAGAPTGAQLRRIFDEVVEDWAAKGGHARHALGQALRVAVSHQRAARLLGERLGWWTRSQSPANLKKALNVCRSSWAADNPEWALEVLHEIEPLARSRALFFGVQNAISTLWLGASLLRNEQPGLATDVAQTLAKWSSSDEKSVFFKRPQQRIAYAIEHELSSSTGIPLVLASALERGELARVVAQLFANGFLRESTRRDIEATLSSLKARANALGKDRAYEAFIGTIQEMGRFVLPRELGGPAPSALSKLARRIEDWLRTLPAPVRPYFGVAGDNMNWVIPIGWLVGIAVMLSLLLSIL